MTDGVPLLVLGVALLGLVAILRGFVGLRPWIRQRLRTPAPIEWEQGIVSADAAVDAPSSDQVYLTFAERLLDSQIATSDILDTKALSGTGVGSTVLPLTFGLLALSDQDPPPITEWLLGIAVLVYIGLLVAAGAALRIRAFEFRPDLLTLQSHSQEIEGAALRRWVAEEYAASSATNKPLLVRKARYVGFATGALFIEGFFISLAAGAALLLL